MGKKNFYCKRVCGNPEFSIDEWNEAHQYCIDAGLSEHESNKIIHTELFPCETQCEDCINTVLDTQIKNKKLRKERAKASVL